MRKINIHHEGRGVLTSFALMFTVACLSSYFFVPCKIVFIITLIICSILMGLALNFFRFPHRKNPDPDNPFVISCPADGEVVVVEEVDEKELLHERCLQVSVFMSLYSVHANWFACNGAVEHVSHQAGAFMKAFLPKSSTENERSAVIIRTSGGGYRVLQRQIAGAVARRIVTYPKPGEEAYVEDFLGFIKFGSRIDLYLPLGSDIKVKPGDKVVGNVSILGYLPQKNKSL